MKKIISTILILGVLLTNTAYAKEYLKYVKSEEKYDYGSKFVYIAKDVKTGKLIPLSIGPLDGYSYAYNTYGDEIEIAKIPYSADFSDLNQWQKTDMYIEEMGARGVLIGYEDGTYKPQRELTRAEMATVFCRLFSIEQSDAPSVFTDVNDDSWYKGYVMALYEKGVFKKDALFNPDSFITREQLIAMTYRMLSDLGYTPNEAEKDYSQYKDLDEISDYAKEPYMALMNSGYLTMVELVDNDFMDTADDEFYVCPKKTVTRLECAGYLYNFIRTFTGNNAPAIKKADAPDIEIPVLDGSTSTYNITQNIYSAFYKNYNNLDSFPKAHSKTTNSYKRLIDGEVEMIFVPDAGKEVEKYAKEKGVTLKFVPIANEALVFFTSTKNNISNITTEQLHNIYVNNTITNWKDIGGDDAPLLAYCRNTDSGSHAQMENFILDGKEINENIAKERTSVMMSSILTDVDDYNIKNPDSYAMGYSLYYYYFNVQSVLGPVDLKLMSIDGVEPTEETIANSTYPYTTNYYAVVRDGENNPKVDAFLELMQGEFGDNIARISGLGVIK